MKKGIMIFLCTILLVLYFCGCSKNSLFSKEETSDSISVDVAADESEEDTVIEKTNESLDIFVELLGTESENGDIAVTDEFLDNMESVFVMGRTGTVVHGFGDDTETVISIMEWVDNDSASKEEFDKFIISLNDFFGETGQIKSYENYSEETYVWKDYDNTSYVLCWYVDDTIKMSWHFDKTITKVENTELILDNNNKVTFTNEYGTPTTKCSHSGCNNYIASSGDTNCCTQHSNRCLECNKYIDEDALYCVACIENAANELKLETHTCEECGKEGRYTITGITGQTEYYCYTHYKELQDMYESLFGND